MSCRWLLGRERLWLFLLAVFFVGNVEARSPIDACIVLLEEWAQNRPTLVSTEQEIQERVDGEAQDTSQDNSQDSSQDTLLDDELEPVPLEQRLVYDACPDQVDTLVQHPLWPLSVRGPQQLMLLDLRGFYAFSDQYEKYAALEVLDGSKLANVLQGLDLPEPEPVSVWQRILDWLKQWWQSEDSEDYDWLERFIPSETTLKIIMFVSIGLVVVLAIGIVVTELRLGLAHRRRTQNTRWSGESIQTSHGLSLEDVQAAPLAEQPGLLLRWLLEQLQASGLLGLRASLTHRDITAATANLDQGQSVAQVSSAAERATFGGWVPNEREMRELLELGKSVSLQMSEHES